MPSEQLELRSKDPMFYLELGHSFVIKGRYWRQIQIMKVIGELLAVDQTINLGGLVLQKHIAYIQC